MTKLTREQLDEFESEANKWAMHEKNPKETQTVVTFERLIRVIAQARRALELEDMDHTKETQGAIKVLEFANGPGDWGDLADLHNWLNDGFDLDDSINRLTEQARKRTE